MWIRRLSGALLLSLPLLGSGAGSAPRPAHAESDVFTLRGIEVDVTAETAAAARETALAEGHVKAMQKLLTRLLPREELAWVRPLEPGEIVGLVKDFEVVDERSSDVRYLANLTFRFKPGPVRDLLRVNGLVYAETRSKPVLVLPVYGPAGEAALWEESNPWWRAWAGRRPGDWLVPLIVPLGDLGDIAAIDAEQTLNGDAERLSRIARRYGADDVLITQAVLLGDLETGQMILEVGTSRLGAQTQQTLIDNYPQSLGETLDELLARAAGAVDGEVQESWKQRNLLRSGTRRRITVTVPVGRLEDWLEVKRRLRGVAAVQRSAVSALSRTRTEVELTFVGDEQQLIVAMAQSDLTLSLNPVSGWQLELRGAEPEAGPVAAPAPGPGSGVVHQPPAEAATAAPAQSAPASE